MQVFIDSNQFISDFLLKSAPFRYLLHFLSNSGSTLASRASGDREEVIFVSSNWRDFYETGPGKQSKPVKDGKNRLGGQSGQPETTGHSANGVLSAQGSRVEAEFHPDLAHDLKVLKRPVLPFDSVATFVETKVDKHKHAINYEKRFELFEDFLEENGLNILGRLEESNGSLVLQRVFSLATASALTILSSDAETFEGVEDFDIYVAEDIEQRIYISCGYDLRIVNVTLFVPRIQFDAHRYEIEEAPHVWEVTQLDETVAIRLSLRSYYQASFSFDPRTLECEGFSLNSFDVR